MIALSGISKQYGRQMLFVDTSFQLNPGEKVGLVGPNGSGKTTLFRMITGEEQADEGDVSVPKKLTIGYFRQDIEEMSGRSVLDEAIAGSGRVGNLHHELEQLQQALEDPDRADEMDTILERFGEVQDESAHEIAALETRTRERDPLTHLYWDPRNRSSHGPLPCGRFAANDWRKRRRRGRSKPSDAAVAVGGRAFRSRRDRDAVSRRAMDGMERHAEI